MPTACLVFPRHCLSGCCLPIFIVIVILLNQPVEEQKYIFIVLEKKLKIYKYSQKQK